MVNLSPAPPKPVERVDIIRVDRKYLSEPVPGGFDIPRGAESVEIMERKVKGGIGIAVFCSLFEPEKGFAAVAFDPASPHITVADIPGVGGIPGGKPAPDIPVKGPAVVDAAAFPKIITFGKVAKGGFIAAFGGKMEVFEALRRISATTPAVKQIDAVVA